MRSTTFPTRLVHEARARAQHGDPLIDALGAALSCGDPLADAAVEALSGPSASRILDAALAGDRSAAPAALVALLESLEQPPAWVDWGGFDRGGQAMIEAGLPGGVVLGARSLLMGYIAPGGNKPLAFSGRLNAHAHRRIAETARFVQAVCQPGGMRPGAQGFNITVRVRLMHARVRMMILRSGRWDEGAWGVPINQHDMMATIMLFSLVWMEGMAIFGAPLPEPQARELLQLWRYVGHVIGVSAQVAPATLEEAKRYMAAIRATQGPPDEDARALVRAFIQSQAPAHESARAREVREAFQQEMVRLMLGDTIADALGLERSVAAHLAVRSLRHSVAAVGRLRHLPGGQEAFARAGQRYWDWSVAVGLGGVPARFDLPDKLAEAG